MKNLFYVWESNTRKKPLLPWTVLLLLLCLSSNVFPYVTGTGGTPRVVPLKEQQSNAIIKKIGLDEKLFQIFIMEGVDTIIQMKPDTTYQVLYNFFPIDNIKNTAKRIPYRMEIANKVLYGLILSDLILEKGLEIVNSKISGVFSIFACDIKRRVIISGCSIEYAEIENSTFQKCFFTNNTVLIKSYFYNDIFNSESEFTGNEFICSAYFDKIKFNNTALGLKFNKKVTFIESKFLGNTYFSRTSFLDTTIFNNCFFEKESNMLTVTTKKFNKCNIDLSGTNADMLKFDFRNFNIFFKDSISFDQKNSIYSNILNAQKAFNMPESYKALDIEYKDFLCSHSESWTDFFIYWIPKKWDEYGHTKSKIFGNIFYLLFIFIGLNFIIGIHYLNEKIYTINNIQFTKVKETEKFSCIKKRFLNIWQMANNNL